MVKILRYSDEDLQEFKAIIDNKLEKSRAELKYLYDQMVGTENNGDTSSSGDYFDYSARHVELEMLTKMASRQRLFIRNLENALLRIRNKTYGICKITGNLIRKERLILVPHATKSVAGKGGAHNPRRNRPPFNSGPSNRRAS